MSIYAVPKDVSGVDQCYFYHTMDIPGVGTVQGEWDLREGAADYLGNVDLKGKRVLEIGAASGFMSFFMESQGAEVVAYDLSEKESWDIVPYSDYDYNDFVYKRKLHIEKINNAFWLAHKSFNSKVNMVHGTVYAIPEEIGKVDISTFGLVLVHVRDPFLALQNALRLTRKTVVITEVAHENSRKEELMRRLLGKKRTPHMGFEPNFHECFPFETWWRLTPEILKQFIGVLGFDRAETFYHYQKCMGQRQKMVTVVGHRT